MILAAVKSKAVGHVINVASGQPITIRAVIEKVMKLIGSGQPSFGAYPYRPGENMELYAYVSLAYDLLDWQATTSLEDGLKKTISWHTRRFKG